MCRAILATTYPLFRTKDGDAIRQGRPQRRRGRADGVVSPICSGRRAVRTMHRPSRHRSPAIRRSVAAATPSKDCRALRHLFQEENEGKYPSIPAAKTNNYSPSRPPVYSVTSYQTTPACAGDARRRVCPSALLAGSGNPRGTRWAGKL